MPQNAFRKISRIFSRSYTSGALIVLVAIFVAITANTAFFSTAATVFSGANGDWLFLASLFASLSSLFILLLSALCHRILVKPMLIAFLLLSATLAFFAREYGTVFDTQMVANVLETDTREAGDLFNTQMIIWISLLGLLPAVAVARARLIFPDWKTETISRLKIAGGAFAVIAVSLLTDGGHYAALLREHREITNKVVPTYAFLSATRLAIQNLPLRKAQHVAVGLDAKLPSSDVHNELVIFIVGETVRADHWGLNGYARDTTPKLRQAGVINFPDFWSCGTSTAYSVPCIFSNLGRDHFSTSEANASDNALDVLKRANVNVLWRDNNSSSKGVADRVTYQDYKSPKLNTMCDGEECRDEGMLVGLQDYIDRHPGDNLIVLHQMGNHGPAYYKRYPKSFERYTPVCRTNDLGSCSHQEIVNAYDNAILYTDYFLSKVIDLLKANETKYETAMLYVSDHGESLGEYGLYLHGAPYALAPTEQKHVPAVIWLSDAIKHDIETKSIESRRARQWSHDNIFSTLLGFFEIRSKDYDRQKDILERFTGA